MADKKERTLQVQTVEGKPARGLSWPITKAQQKTLEKFNLAMCYAVPEGRAERRLSKGQFKEPHFYYLYLAEKSSAIAERYKEVAADAKENPSAYKQSRESVAARIAGLQQELDAKLSAAAERVAEKLGITVDEALAMLQGE